MKIVYIDEISSISESIFSLKKTGRIVMELPFACKQKTEKNGASRYHFDKDDLIKIHKYFPEVYEYNQAAGMSKSDYISDMKNAFKRIIMNGDMVQLLSHLYGESIENIEIRWDPKDRFKEKELSAMIR